MNNFSEQSNHPSANLLLRYVDGELEATDAASIRSHLEGCWACRADVQEIEQSIRGYIRFHQKEIASKSVPRHWHGFDLRLWELEKSLGAHTENRFWQVKEMPSRAASMAGVVGALGSVLIMLLFVSPGHSSKLGATELLRRSIRAETSDKGVASRRVRIRYRAFSLVRTPGRDSRTTIADSRSARKVERLLIESQLDWEHPLSAQAFNRWHSHLRKKADEVTRLSDRYRLRTVSNEGLIHQADFEVRLRDFRPLQESLDFGKEGVVEISAIEDARPALIDSGPKPGLPLARHKARIKRPIEKASLDDLEATIRMLLHTVGADLQDAVVIRQTKNAIELTGIVYDSTREEQLVKRISALDGRIHVRIESAEQAAASASPAILDSPAIATGPKFDAPAKAWLEKQFPDPSGREQFVTQSLQLSQDASIRAYALMQLAERYPPVSFNALSPEARTLILRIVADHAAYLDNTWTILRNRLKLLTGPLSLRSNNNRNWQSSAQSCAAATRTLDSALARLLAESTESGQSFPQLVGQVRTSLAESCRVTGF